MQKLSIAKYPQLAAFCLALFVSVCFNTFYLGINHQQESDGLMYSEQAKHFADYLFKTQDARCPLFPAFLSGLYLIFGNWLFGIRFVISLLGALNCVLAYHIAKHTSGKTVAVLTGLAAAVYPNLFFWSGFLLAETLFTTLLLATVYLLVQLNDQTSVKKLILTGLFLGLAALTRSMLLFFFPLLFIWLIYFCWASKKTMLRAIFFIFFATAITILPWTMRNYIVLDAFVPITANGGRAFYGGNNPLSLIKNINGLGLWDNQAREKLLPETKDMSIIETDKYCYKKGGEWVINTLKNRPAEFLQLELWKIQKAWLPLISPRHSTAKKIFLLAYLLVGLFGITGLILSLKEKRKYSLLYFLLIIHLLITLIFFGEMRLRAPFDPILIVFSSLTVVALYEKIEKYIKTI